MVSAIAINIPWFEPTISAVPTSSPSTNKSTATAKSNPADVPLESEDDSAPRVMCPMPSMNRAPSENPRMTALNALPATSVGQSSIATAPSTRPAVKCPTAARVLVAGRQSRTERAPAEGRRGGQKQTKEIDFGLGHFLAEFVGVDT